MNSCSTSGEIVARITAIHVALDSLPSASGRVIIYDTLYTYIRVYIYMYICMYVCIFICISIKTQARHYL